MGLARSLRWLALGVGAFVALALAFDAFVGAAQPALSPGANEGVLRTWGADGSVHESRMVVLDAPDGTLWVQSGHHFRGWYHRLLENPEVELVRGGETRAYRAVAIDTPESEALVVALLKERAPGPRFYAIRTVLLFADIKPVRLDPR